MSFILVVDDMAVIREPIAAALRGAGHEAVCASGGNDALLLIKKRIPDLIVLDLSMPGVDGMAVLRSLRTDSLTSKTPVILLTATADKKRILEAGTMGVHDYLLKAVFSLPELITRVEKYVSLPAETVRSTPAAEVTTPVRQALGSRPSANAFRARTIPSIVSQVIALTATPQSELTELVELISCDPVLAARILWVANDAVHAASREPVSTLKDAVKRLGHAMVGKVATSMKR